MRFGSTADSYREARLIDALKPLGLLGSNLTFLNESYGVSVHALFLTFNCHPSEKGYRQRVKFDISTSTMFIDIMLDYALMVGGGEDERSRHVKDAMATQTEIGVSRLNIPGFDADRFLAEFVEWVNKLPDSAFGLETSADKQIQFSEFKEAVQNSFAPVITSLSFIPSTFPASVSPLTLAYSDGQRTLAVIGSELPRILILATRSSADPKTETHWLRLNFSETYKNGVAAVRLRRYRRGMGSDDPVGYVKLNQIGDLREAAGALAAFAVVNPDVVFPGKPIVVLRKPPPEMMS